MLAPKEANASALLYCLILHLKLREFASVPMNNACISSGYADSGWIWTFPLWQQFLISSWNLNASQNLHTTFIWPSWKFETVGCFCLAIYCSALYAICLYSWRRFVNLARLALPSTALDLWRSMFHQEREANKAAVDLYL